MVVFLTCALAAPAGEPDSKTYWNIDDIRPGMKGTGQTVMVGTKLEEFGAVVLGVMRGVSPGRDMVLCRLTGCNLEHAGIIQGMSGSPIYIDGKLLGAVAFAWEFGKDPIAGVTPFQQMVQYVRASDKRIAAEAKDRAKGELSQAQAGRWDVTDAVLIDGVARDGLFSAGPSPVSGGTLAAHAGDRHAAGGDGFQSPYAGRSERAAAAAGPGTDGPGGAARPSGSFARRGTSRSSRGAPLSIAMVTGDFDPLGAFSARSLTSRAIVFTASDTRCSVSAPASSR